MRIAALVTVTFALFSCVNLLAQKKSNQLYKWEKYLLQPNNYAPSNHVLGYAGMFGGIYNNQMIIGGGANFPDAMPWLGGQKKYSNKLFVYSQNKEGQLVLTPKTFFLPFNLAYAASCSSNRGVFAIGGENEEGPVNHAFFIQLIDDQLKITSLPSIPYKVTNAMVCLIDEKIYLIGGENKEETLSQLLCLNLNELDSGWLQLPAIPFAVSHAVASLQTINGMKKIFIIGGRKKNKLQISDLYDSIIEFDIMSKTWTSKNTLPYALSAGTGFALNNHQVLLLGGDRGTTFSKVEQLLLDINGEQNPAIKASYNQQKINLQSTHPGFSKEIILIDNQTNTLTIAGQIPYDVPVTTTIFPWKNKWFLPSGEIKAGVRSPFILSISLNP
jgi:N-acetylneuraminic acid mutarotase